MPLKLNLHHEIDKQKALQRRDPLKFAGAGIAAIVAAFAAYYAYELNVAHSLNMELASVQSDLEKLQPQADVAHKREEELSVSIKNSENLVKRVEGRFYWAPVLGLLSTIVPREVQVTRLAGDVNGESLKHCSITIDGVATGKDPRATAEELRKALGDSFSSKFKNVTSTFKGNIEDNTEKANLDGRTLPTVEFTIVVQLQYGEEENKDNKGRKPGASRHAA
jgi:hypothetical protein